jgi:hypothetical protein
MRKTGPNGIVFEIDKDCGIEALGSKGARYTIDPNTLACSCLSFKYSQEPQSCKHSRDAKALGLDKTFTVED